MSRFIWPDSVYVEMQGWDEDGNRVEYRIAMEPESRDTSRLTWKVDHHTVNDDGPPEYFERIKPSPDRIIDTSIIAERWRFVDCPDTSLVERLVQERLEQERAKA